MLIGLTGLAGSGKSVVASILTSEFCFTRVKFADPLKNMLRRMLCDMGFCSDDVERMLEGDLKESEIPELGVTPRRLMQALGTEFGRDAIRPDLWIRLWAARADNFTHVVADDVRFSNEVDIIRARAGIVVRVHRPGLVGGSHISEQLDVAADYLIVNDGTLEDLRHEARRLVTSR